MAQTETRLDFGPFRLYPERVTLYRESGELIGLSFQATQVLALLVQARGRLVERENLITQVWPHTFVSDGSLTQLVFMLRKALGDSYESPKYIATVERRGYRFLAPVTKVAEEN